MKDALHSGASFCRAFDIDLISMIAPASEKRIAMIAKEAEGFLSIVSSSDVISIRNEIKTDLKSIVEQSVKNSPFSSKGRSGRIRPSIPISWQDVRKRYPDLETTAAAVRAAADNGADLIELGIPFSDPTAEGPVIQAATQGISVFCRTVSTIDFKSVLISFGNLIKRLKSANFARFSANFACFHRANCCMNYSRLHITSAENQNDNIILSSDFFRRQYTIQLMKNWKHYMKC